MELKYHLIFFNLWPEILLKHFSAIFAESILDNFLGSVKVAKSLVPDHIVVQKMYLCILQLQQEGQWSGIKRLSTNDYLIFWLWVILYISESNLKNIVTPVSCVVQVFVICVFV